MRLPVCAAVIPLLLPLPVAVGSELAQRDFGDGATDGMLPVQSGGFRPWRGTGRHCEDGFGAFHVLDVEPPSTGARPR